MIYFGLVLVPQLLWLLSNSNGITALCDGCSFLTPTSEPQTDKQVTTFISSEAEKPAIPISQLLPIEKKVRLPMGSPLPSMPSGYECRAESSNEFVSCSAEEVKNLSDSTASCGVPDLSSLCDCKVGRPPEACAVRAAWEGRRMEWEGDDTEDGGWLVPFGSQTWLFLSIIPSID